MQFDQELLEYFHSDFFGVLASNPSQNSRLARLGRWAVKHPVVGSLLQGILFGVAFFATALFVAVGLDAGSVWLAAFIGIASFVGSTLIAFWSNYNRAHYEVQFSVGMHPAPALEASPRTYPEDWTPDANLAFSDMLKRTNGIERPLLRLLSGRITFRRSFSRDMDKGELYAGYRLRSRAWAVVILFAVCCGTVVRIASEVASDVILCGSFLCLVIMWVLRIQAHRSSIQ